MAFEIRANEIENKTIAKLTRHEIGKLGLNTVGVYTYKGELKSRLKGLKTTLKTDEQVNFESEKVRCEMIKIVSTNNEGVNEYALRLYNKEKEQYEEFYPILIGCDFFR